MKHIHIHPDDVNWMLRWLRGNVIGVVVLACLMAIIAHNSPRPNSAAMAMLAGEVRASPLDPDGWRRTTNGWEHISTWPPPPRPLAEWIHSQQTREPIWVQRTLAELRQTPPLVFALIQITAIVAVVVITEKK
jgi:hypothetical protein